MVGKLLRKFGRVVVVFLLFIIFIPTIGSANEISNVSVDVQLQSSGTAHIVEKWQADLDEGSELYKPLTLESNQTIENYEVKINGQEMTEVANWDIDGDFDEKAYQYGQHENELNWGISEYGENTYEISYDITNFIAQTSTYQMIYWEFITDEMEPSPENVTLTIHSDKGELTPQDYRLWGFGYQGTAEFTSDGQILAQSSEPFGSSSHLTLLIRLPDGQFPTQFQLDKSFDDYVKEAFEGSHYSFDDYDPDATQEELTNVSEDPMSTGEKLLIGGIGTIGGIGLISAGVVGYNYRKAYKQRKKVYPTLEERSKQLSGEYYRELPYPSFELGCILLLTLDDHNTSHGYSEDGSSEITENILTATILWFVFNEYLVMVPGEKHQELQLTGKTDVPETFCRFYKILEAVSDNDGIIKQKRLKKYIERHYQKLESYLDDLEAESQMWMFNHQYLFKQLQAKKKSEESDLDRANSSSVFPLTEEGLVLRDNLVRFYNYLLDYSLLNERSASEVYIWDELMIFAASLGILDEVEKEFTKLYPQYRQESIFINNRGMTFTDYYIISHLMDQSRATGYLKAHPNLSSGSGGSASFGGGGGSFGGGTGGGVR